MNIAGGLKKSPFFLCPLFIFVFLTLSLFAGTNEAQAAPYVYGFTPSGGTRGDNVIIVGSNFGSSRGASTVSFGDKAVTTYTSWSDKEIVAQVPADAVNGATTITVTIGGTGTTTISTFAVGDNSLLEGLYYLRGFLPSSVPNMMEGASDTGGDYGALRRTKPTAEEIRVCDQWVQFGYDEAGSYALSNNITNIAYHTWWNAEQETWPNYDDVNKPHWGFSTTGGYGIGLFSEVAGNPVYTNPLTDLNHVGTYHSNHLFSAVQTLTGVTVGSDNLDDSHDYDKFGFQLAVGSEQTGAIPSALSSPKYQSYVILNLPAQAVLEARDSDGDDLNDYEEVYTYFTNPYSYDTDGDGYSDSYEVAPANQANGFDPNDYFSAPEFINNPLLTINNPGDYNNVVLTNFGAAVHPYDEQGDGTDEGILVGDPFGASKVFLFDSSGALLTTIAGASFGNALETADIDGDGSKEILIGAPMVAVSGKSQVGKVYVYSSTGTLEREIYDDTLDAQSYFGTAIANLGDIDGDGSDDVIIGSTGFGKVYLYKSGSDTPTVFDNGVYGFGAALANAGDQTGDGINDFVVTNTDATPDSKYQGGLAYLFDSTDNSGAISQLQLTTPDAYDTFGYSVAAIDVTGDSKKEIIVGATGWDNAATNPDEFDSQYYGAAFVFSFDGDPIIYESATLSDEPTAKSYFGTSITSLSDMTGDGKDEIAVSSRGGREGLYKAGGVTVFSSDDFSILKEYKQIDPKALSQFGYSIARITDQNGDGLDDLLIGAPSQWQGAGKYIGAAYLFATGGKIGSQSWAKGDSYTTSFALSDYFSNPNGLTLAYSVVDSSDPITATINDDKTVTFSQPSWWAGSGTASFRVTDPTGQALDTNSVSLTVTGTSDATAPTKTAFEIAEGAGFPESRSVTLTIGATDDESDAASIDMEIANNESFEGASWEDYAVTKDWALEQSGDDTRYVYIRFRDAAGNISSAYSDTISLAPAIVATPAPVLNSSGSRRRTLNFVSVPMVVPSAPTTSPVSQATTSTVSNPVHAPAAASVKEPKKPSKPSDPKASSVKKIIPLLISINERTQSGLSAMKAVFLRGEKMTFRGKAAPNSTVRIYIHSDPMMVEVKTDADGNWSYTLDKELPAGEHKVEAEALDSAGSSSPKVEIARFEIVDKNGVADLQSEMPSKSYAGYIWLAVAIFLLVVVYYLYRISRR